VEETIESELARLRCPRPERARGNGGERREEMRRLKSAGMRVGSGLRAPPIWTRRRSARYSLVCRVADEQCHGGAAAFTLSTVRADGEITFGSSGLGGGSHLGGELFNIMDNVKLTPVPYKGSAMATLVLSGEIQVAFNNPTSSLPHIKAGRLRLVAVTTRKTLATFAADADDCGVGCGGL
jgi:hypothetical protein